ncbi:alpha-L RNA-binding motif-containing protein [Polychaeton citri CBS 116435]|uniref:Alpha-L RNA-binding motif-containing protein n=1 Tax=Polychaeton citri CBS 116435 TaxID=1314669 RepID=A0A9P4UNT1_9PEZI|nr:alpha-L RNA-binding motif-containing protein [Polychaeton citri CBS 116435]
MPRKFHGLKKPKVRQDWSKENLYNLSRATIPTAANKTFFQQKWLAKSITRAYHNPHVREGTWTRMFDRRLPAVVPMNYRYLARHDGSELASGRGSGLTKLSAKASGKGRRGDDERPPEKTPYMHMAYHPLERRLDTAIWRALFASSTRQARQFVTHGWVKVNGKKMIYPGYLLNPGDMFSVEPDRVLYATGARKLKTKSNRSLQHKVEPRPTSRSRKVQRKSDPENEESPDATATTDSAEGSGSVDKLPDEYEDPKQTMKALRLRARQILDESKTKLSGKRQQELRLFARSVWKLLSKARGEDKTKSKFIIPVDESVQDLEATLGEIIAKIPIDDLPKEETKPADGSNPQARADDAYTARKEAELLHAALARAQENPIDARKPYATPWQPREYMSAFAFIPRYLEVNQNICSAVYLRHPVARPGLAEVPTPFHAETSALAFNWYLRRR